jgi:hypothetical protein
MQNNDMKGTGIASKGLADKPSCKKTGTYSRPELVNGIRIPFGVCRLITGFLSRNIRTVGPSPEASIVSSTIR